MTVETDNTFEAELNERQQKLHGAASDISTRAAEAEASLPGLRKQLGEVILSAALGEVSTDEISELRMAIFRAERDIEAAGFIIEPVRKREARLHGEYTKLGQRRGYRKRYEELKKKISESSTNSMYFHNSGINIRYTTELRNLNRLADGDTCDSDIFIAAHAPSKASA